MHGNKTPLALVNDQYGGKAKLVDKLVGMLEPRHEGEEEDKASLKTRLQAASNKKLIRLLKVTEAVQEKYGSRDKLVAAVADALGRAKDSDFVKRLSAFTNGRLLDMARTLGRRGQAAAAASAASAQPKAERPAKAKAEKPAKDKAVKASAKAAKPAKAKAAAKKPAAAKKAPAKKPAKK